jgi:signal transduction histidine kinase
MVAETVTVPTTTVITGSAFPAALRLAREWNWERLVRERAAAEAQVRALAGVNRRMEEFLGIATHELKTPVTSSTLAVALAARGMRELLDEVVARENALDAELAGRVAALQELLTRAEEGLGRLTRLVVDLLDVSRIRTGRFDLRLAPCDLAAVVEETVEEQRQIAPARTIRLHLPDRRAVPVVADASRIRQVVTNYLMNALRYSQADRPVEVGIQVQRDWARVVVRDAGPGLTPAEQQRIWECFHRVAGVPVVSHDTGAGLGLGLYICKTIVEQHRGRIGLRSRPGRGSTFWFALAVASVDRHRIERTGDP